MRVRLLAMIGAVAALTAAQACGDSLNPRANYTNLEGSFTLYAFNGSPSTKPSALLLSAGSAEVVDPSFNYDIAFDINDSGWVQVYTVSALASQFVPAHRVGLQLSTTPFDQALVAPTGGYTYDSSLVISVGKTVFIDAIPPGCQLFSFSILGPNVRAKVVVDSAKISTRQIWVHFVSNPNCGFRSLVPGGELPPE